MTTVEELRSAGYFTPLDSRFAQTLARLANERLSEAPRPEVLLAAALASHQMTEGHVCVDLAKPPAPVDAAGEPIADVRWPAATPWIAALRTSALVSLAGPDAGIPQAPLVLDSAGRVYLQRFWCHQQELARELRERARALFTPRDPKRLRAELVRLFPESDASFPWQRAAALSAVRRGLTVVTGGPGTGKTATVVRMLALLVGEAVATGARPPRILLVAPTGKAAARLGESIDDAIPRLRCAASVLAYLTELPRTASTIHRALGTYGGTASRFRHDADNPLVADVVVVDEASMVDLALMNRLVAAIPRRARLVLLGDRDQLASVEAGAVLGDLCDPQAIARTYSTPHVKELASLGSMDLPAPRKAVRESGLRDSIVRLVHSYRYGETSGIGRLSAAIREQRPAEALRVLESGDFPDVVRVDPPPQGVLHAASEKKIVGGFRAALQTADAVAALCALDGFRVLCAHRRGPFGVEALNGRIVELLRELDLVGSGDIQYRGRAVLVTRNDYDVALFNGDVGLVMRDPDDDARLLAVFTAPGGKLRRLSPARLPTHETAFAMTVHKSQGSEVDEVVVVLPEKSPIVTRELLYTAVTRARKRVVIQASPAAIEEGIRAETQRASGLRDLLWGSGRDAESQGSFRF
jgi:exodeoxyribonuclease V alpha subunit